MIYKCVTHTTGMSQTRYSDILIYPTYYHVTSLVGLTDSDCIIKCEVSCKEHVISFIDSRSSCCRYFICDLTSAQCLLHPSPGGHQTVGQTTVQIHCWIAVYRCL